ncbi:hypothetical protein MU1_28060 [Paenibacillus glycanilyticus]|uniref:Uncharacterized protein n=1 Tax=Paenibacillus glycanilyticus TaxID=126569 RepID=A0ABQ6GBW9_9BACL|nr:hypothetical protein MU1_28060 [Paenibacillus glycanilyticus]
MWSVGHIFVRALFFMQKYGNYKIIAVGLVIWRICTGSEMIPKNKQSPLVKEIVRTVQYN